MKSYLAVTLWGLAAWAVFILTLSGCDLDRPLTNQEIAEQIEFCHAHHLTPVAYTAYGEKNNMVYAIQCRAADETTPTTLGGWAK